MFSPSLAISFNFGKIFSSKIFSSPKLPTPKITLPERTFSSFPLAHERPPAYNPFFNKGSSMTQDSLYPPLHNAGSFSDLRPFPPPYSKNPPLFNPGYSNLHGDYPPPPYSRNHPSLDADHLARPPPYNPSYMRPSPYNPSYMRPPPYNPSEMRPPPYNPSFMNEAPPSYSKTAPTLNNNGQKPSIDPAQAPHLSGSSPTFYPNRPPYVPHQPYLQGEYGNSKPSGLLSLPGYVPVPLPIPVPRNDGYSSSISQESILNSKESTEDSEKTERPRLMAIQSGEIEGLVQLPAGSKLQPWSPLLRKNR